MKKILVADDEPDIVDTLTIRLEAAGFEVITAFDGLEALNKAREQQPDLIILDVMLPKLDGFQVSRLIKFDEKYSGTPILMLTAKTQEKDKVTGLKMGADGYITKPYDPQELLRTIRSLLHMEDI
jgi:DNA-binding response OmpR family regulator